MSSGPDQQALGRVERQRLIFNEKCKAQGSFFFNLSVAIIAAGPVASFVRMDPSLDGPLTIISLFFGAIFYLVGNNRLDRMESEQ